MFLIAKNRKDFVKTLIAEVETARSERSFAKRVKGLKRLAFLDLSKFRVTGTDRTEPSFKRIRFKVTPQKVATHTVSLVTGPETYRCIAAHGIERIVRAFFVDHHIRKVIELIVKGDEVLAEAIRRGRCYMDMWDHNSEDLEDNDRVSLLPVDVLGPENQIMITGEMPSTYLKDLSLLAVFYSVVHGRPQIPLGIYKVTSTEAETAETPPEVDARGFVPFIIEPRLETFKPFEKETIHEKLFNASLGNTYFAKSGLLCTIGKVIMENIQSSEVLKRVLILLCSLTGTHDDEDIVFDLIRKTLGFLESTLDYEIKNLTFTGKRRITNRVFYNTMADLEDETLFSIAKDPGMLRVVDEFGVENQNVQQYILREQIRRFRNRPELDENVRHLMNRLDFGGKQSLMELAFLKERKI